jgi:hypothetical protein
MRAGEEGTAQETNASPSFQRGLLLQVGFGDAVHELSYSEIRGRFEGVAYVEFQRVRRAPSLSSPCIGLTWRNQGKEDFGRAMLAVSVSALHS